MTFDGTGLLSFKGFYASKLVRVLCITLEMQLSTTSFMVTFFALLSALISATSIISRDVLQLHT